MGFLDKLREAGDAAQRAAQQLGNMQQRSGQQGEPGTPPAPGAAPAAAQQRPEPSDAPPFSPAQPVPQGFRLERALNGAVSVAEDASPLAAVAGCCTAAFAVPPLGARRAPRCSCWLD